MNRHERSEEFRQAALDYISEHPGALGPDVAAALGWTVALAAGRLTTMARRGEVCRSKVTRGMTWTYAYTAAVSKTKSAHAVYSALVDNFRNPAHVPDPQHARQRNIDPERSPIPNQGGQGAVRHEIRRGCSLT